MIAGVVVEGKRDFPILEAALKTLWPAIERVLPIHPPRDALSGTRFGGIETGWAGVRRWCRRYGPTLTRFVRHYGEPLDILVVCVDASIAHRQEINREAPCPPASATTNGLRELVIGWLGGRLPEDVIVAIPSKTTDAWVCAAIVGGDELLECDPEPLERLVDAGGLGFTLKLTSDGKVRKPSARRYDLHLAPRVAERSARDVESVCSQEEMDR
jgi:hypothetical protein